MSEHRLIQAIRVSAGFLAQFEQFKASAPNCPSTASPRVEAAIGAARYPDAGATEVLLSPLLAPRFNEALRVAEALA